MLRLAWPVSTAWRYWGVLEGKPDRGLDGCITARFYYEIAY
jgi:hypothetical protein